MTTSGPGMPIAMCLGGLPVSKLRELAGPVLVRTLEILGGEAADDRDSLVRVMTTVAQQRGATALEDPLFRKQLIDSLPLEKARELAERLRVPVSPRIFSDIEHVDFDFDKSAFQELAGFFGLVEPPRAPAGQHLSVEQVSPSFGLFEHQRVAADQVLNAIAAPPGRVVLHMPTGAGKTRTAMHVVCRLLNGGRPKLIVWLAQSSELLEQAVDAFLSAWNALGNRDVTLVRLWGSGQVPDISGISDGLVVGGLAKLHSLNSRDQFALLNLGRKSALVVIDEAHQAIAPTYKTILEKLADAGRESGLLGLTATPGRTWSDLAEDEKLSEFFCHNKVILTVPGYSNPVKYLMDEGYLAEPTFEMLKVPPTTLTTGTKRSVADDDDYSAEVLSAVSQNAERNAAILKKIKEVIARHKRVIVFASSVQNAELFMSLLTATGITAYVITGETPKGQREYAIRQYKTPSPDPIVLCNYGVLTTGFDAPGTSAAIVARPTKSLVLFSQMVGRATRGVKAGGNRTCEIVTVVDPDLPGFGDVAEAFVNWEDVWGTS